MTDRRELSAVAFERTKTPMVMCDARLPDCPIIIVNEAFLGLTGYTKEEVIGKNCRFLQGAGTSPSAVAELRFAIAKGRDLDVELLNYRKDGSPFWNQLHLSAIHDDDGEIAYFFGSQVDVTEFRKIQSLEASERRLLMEVDHRAKNVLAIVDSIVRLSKSSDPAAYAAAVQQRVQSLAQAHALLSHAGWKSVGLRDVIEAQLSKYQHSNIYIVGPETEIAPEIVQPLSLIVHELAVNAVSHGSLSSAHRGHLAVDWEKIGNGGFRLSWRETGGRLTAGERQPGFGTVIVRALLEKQLGGNIKRDWQDDGVLIEVEVPNGG